MVPNSNKGLLVLLLALTQPCRSRCCRCCLQSALADVSQMTGIATIALMAMSRFSFEYLGWKGECLSFECGLVQKADVTHDRYDSHCVDSHASNA